jgi:hypothetical protein
VCSRRVRAEMLRARAHSYLVNAVRVDLELSVRNLISYTFPVFINIDLQQLRFIEGSECVAEIILRSFVTCLNSKLETVTIIDDGRWIRKNVVPLKNVCFSRK